MKLELSLLAVLVAAPLGVSAHKADKWRNRRVYQVLTDRFARSWSSAEETVREQKRHDRLKDGALAIGEKVIDPTPGEVAEAQGKKCDDLTTYCGGSWKGLIENLDYIQGLGFDAVWISPIIQNWPGGYHGYWAKDLFNVNEKFGTHGELWQLGEELRKRGMYFMVDVVANHMSPAPQVMDEE